MLPTEKTRLLSGIISVLILSHQRPLNINFSTGNANRSDFPFCRIGNVRIKARFGRLYKTARKGGVFSHSNRSPQTYIHKHTNIFCSGPTPRTTAFITQYTTSRQHFLRRQMHRVRRPNLSNSSHMVIFRQLMSKALPLPKNTPSRTPIRQHQPSPKPPFSDLDDCFPNPSIRPVSSPGSRSTDGIITFP